MTDDPATHVCDDWLSVRLADWRAVLDAQDALSAAGGWTDIVPGLDSITVRFDPALTVPGDADRRLRAQLATPAARSRPAPSPITVPVCYDAAFAPDRERIADRLNIPVASLPAWHSAQPFRVTLLGFMPGFAYLERAEPCPPLGRLDSPRVRVPAGSVGVIGRQNCLYSFDSPGGWPIIGRTPVRLFDGSSSPPALLAAGQEVRFAPISRARFDRWNREPGG